MNKFGAALRRVAEFLGWQRPDASAAAVSRFEYRHSLAGAGKFTGCHQPCGAGADHDEMRQVLSGSRHHREIVEITPDASADLRTLGGHRLLHGGTRQHALAVLHDPR